MDPPLQVVRAGGLRWLVKTRLSVSQMRPLLDHPDGWLGQPEFHFKHTNSVTVARIPGLDGLPNLVLRRLNYGKVIHRFRDWFRPSRARRAFYLGLRLEQAGIATPRPVAVAEARWLGWPLGAYLLTEEIPGAQMLVTFLTQNPSPSGQTVRRLADLLARLHDQGFSHRDLKRSNVLLDQCQQPYLIDLDGVRFYGRVTEGRAVADLARLAEGLAHFPGLLRVSGWKFLVHYCAQRGAGLEPRRLAASIAAARRP